MLTAQPALGRNGMAEQPSDIVRIQPLQDKDTTARQERTVDLKRRVLRRCPDQDDAALLDEREKRILLCLVEAVDLIDKDDDALPVHTTAIRLLHHRPYILDAASHRREVDKLCLRTRCDDLGECRLTDTGRSPEDHGGAMVAFDEAAQHLPLAEEVFLPDELLK